MINLKTTDVIYPRMEPTNSTATIRDVAAEAGVSVSTVSRALNDKDDISAETRLKIQAIAEELGYTSGLAARSMRSQKTHNIGLVVYNLRKSFPLPVIKGSYTALETTGYNLLVYAPDQPFDGKFDREQRRQVRQLMGLTDGTLVLSNTMADFPKNHPLVVINADNGQTTFHRVIATHYEGARSAVKYLLELGHRRIGFIGGPSTGVNPAKKLAAYRDCLSLAGVEFDPNLVRHGNFTMERGHACAQTLLRLPKRPSAIFAMDDRAAVGVIKAAQEQGLNVPADLSVIGFNDTIECLQIRPQLTTVSQFLEKIGYTAAQVLLKLIQGTPPENTLHQIKTKLIIRDSCQAPKEFSHG